MSCILRVDDFIGTKPGEFWRHNLDNFKRFDAILEKYNVSYVLGVIPRYTTEEHIKWLAQNPRIEVALHGINHDERFPNEFREYETAEQICERLMSAKYPLKECNSYGDVDRYIPPHNVIDLKTVGALDRAKFKTIFCGPGTEDLPMRYARELGMEVFYSPFPNLYGRTDEMMHPDVFSTIEKASVGKVMTLHWTWEWNIGLESLHTFMSRLSHIFGSK